jgi:antitoxin ParD1/3/4
MRGECQLLTTSARGGIHSLEETRNIMATETLHISLPDSLKRYVEERVGEGGYGNTSEYLRELIRADRDARRLEAQRRLETLLLEGLENGEPTPMTQADWETIRREARNRLQARKPDASEA